MSRSGAVAAAAKPLPSTPRVCARTGATITAAAGGARVPIRVIDTLLVADIVHTAADESRIASNLSQ